LTRVLLDAVVRTDYGMLTIEWDEDFGDGDPAPHFAGQVNGLAGAARPGRLWLVLARRSGGSAVRIETTDAPPEVDPLAEDVVEVSIIIPPGAQPQWVTWAAEETGVLELEAGSYRARVSARGRDAGADGEFAEEVVDSYVVELWPGDPAPDTILRTTSRDAAYWHDAWGSSRD
jgi:hypothetical protein